MRWQISPQDTPFDVSKLFNFPLSQDANQDDPDLQIWSIKAQSFWNSQGHHYYAVESSDSDNPPRDLVSAFMMWEENKILYTLNTPIKMIYRGRGVSHFIKNYFDETARIHHCLVIKNYCRRDNFRQIGLNESHGYLPTNGYFANFPQYQEWEKTLKNS